MEKNNDDIIFNKISQKTIDRQNKILSRLLDFDEAEREQGEDDKRESLEWIMKNDIETIDEEISRQKKKNIQYTIYIRFLNFMETKVAIGSWRRRRSWRRRSWRRMRTNRRRKWIRSILKTKTNAY